MRIASALTQRVPRFGALELAFAKGMSARRIDQTDHVSGLVEGQSRCLRPGAGGFEAGVNRTRSVFAKFAKFAKPRDECCMTRCVVGKNLMAHPGAFLQQCGIQGAFADIDP